MENLPGNYTALYALATLPETDWQELLQSGRLSTALSSRRIQAWKVGNTARNQGYEKQTLLILAAKSDCTREILTTALKQMDTVAKEHGMILVLPPSYLNDLSERATPEEVAEKISKVLLSYLEKIVADAGRVLKDELQIQSGNDLLDSSCRNFLKFINRTAGSTAAALKSYGKEHCLKLALEYNRTSNSRANRSNYKKKLLDYAEGSSGEQIAIFAKRVLKDFIA